MTDTPQRQTMDRSALMRAAWALHRERKANFARHDRWAPPLVFTGEEMALCIREARYRLSMREHLEAIAAADRAKYAHLTPEQRAQRLIEIEEDLVVALYGPTRIRLQLEEERRLLRLHPVATGVIVERAA